MTKIMKLKVKFAKFIRSIKNSNDIPFTTSQKYAASIFRLSLKDPDAELLSMPIQKKRILKLNHKGSYYIIEDSRMSLINHKYSYIIELSYSLKEKLIKMFDKKLDTTRYKQEETILNQIDSGLLTILESFKQS